MALTCEPQEQRELQLSSQQALNAMNNIFRPFQTD